MPLISVWIALGLSVVASTTGAVRATRRGLDLWHDLGRVQRSLGDGLEGFFARAEPLSERMAAPAGRSAELQRSFARLRVALAQLAVLRAAIKDVRDAVGGLTAVYPRK